MKPAAKKERSIAKAMAGLASLMVSRGIQTDITVANAKEVAREVTISKPLPLNDAEAVLSFIEKPARFAFKPCKRCGEMFGTSYRAVAYCGDNCRAKHLLETTGIRWDPHKSAEERWGGEPPQVLPPLAVAKLLQIAQQQNNLPVLDRSEFPEEQEQPTLQYNLLVEIEPQMQSTLEDNLSEEKDPYDLEKTNLPESKSLVYSVENLMEGLFSV